MLKNITLGQYFPGNSVVHRLDPRTKLTLTFVYIVALFLSRNAFGYGLMFASLFAIVAVSGIKPKLLLRGLRPLIIIISITAFLNVFYTRTGTELVHFWKITITDDGVRNAVFMLLRITMLVSGTFLLTYTTSPLHLTDAMEALMRPLKRIRFPVHELSMMMSIALRFIPTLIEETDKIMSAQKARGADFDNGNLLQKAKALLPLLIPLFVSAFRRADELAVAMESRCYHGGEGRTKMKQLKYGRVDVLAYVAGAVVLAAAIVLRTLSALLPF
jgi:energy-coupling factor transport system permease protein